MKHLDDLNPNKFYTQLALEGHLIEEVIDGVDEDGNWSTFYNFEDAFSEAEYEDVTLNEYGNATYYYKGKIYEVVVYLENNEGAGINELDIHEIKSLIYRLRKESDELGFSELDFLEKEPWVNEVFSFSASDDKILVFKGNFGELTLNINGTKATGTYQENGTLKGEFINNTFKGQWENKGMEGLVVFIISDDKLEGNWKKGLEPGPMKGIWKGSMIDVPKDTTEQQTKEEDADDWNIIHDIFCFYTFFANLANEGSQEVENIYVQTEIQKWKFELNGLKYGLDYGNPINFMQLADSVFDALYMDGDSTNKDPFIQLNESYFNLARYFNQGVLNCSMITTLWSSMFKLCQLRGITEWQDQQLRWHLQQWGSVCSDLTKLIALLDLGEVMQDTGEAVVLEFDEKYHEAKEIILSEGAALPEILCDVLLIGKNRAERIFDQFERDGIVSPKDENGKRKIIKS